MHQGMPNKYNFGNIAPELSVSMFEAHWKLYEGYCQSLVKVLSQLSNPYDQEISNSANPVDGKFRELEESKSFLTNAVLLHELFFENCILPDNSAPMIPGEQFTSLIQRDFPHVKSNDFWDVIIKPTAKAARGWCIVGFNTLSSKLDVCMLDSHSGIVPIGIYPLLVIDVYEHSYAMQYGIDRGTYLTHLRRTINWAVVEHRVAVISSASELMRISVPEEAEEYIRDHVDEADREFGFPDEDSFPDHGKPTGYGLDNRSNDSLKNPRAFSSVQDTVTTADLDEAFQKIRMLSVISFRSEDDLFDEQVKGRSSRFREQLWAMLQDKSGDTE